MSTMHQNSTPSSEYLFLECRRGHMDARANIMYSCACTTTALTSRGSLLPLLVLVFVLAPTTVIAPGQRLERMIADVVGAIHSVCRHTPDTVLFSWAKLLICSMSVHYTILNSKKFFLLKNQKVWQRGSPFSLRDIVEGWAQWVGKYCIIIPHTANGDYWLLILYCTGCTKKHASLYCISNSNSYFRYQSEFSSVHWWHTI